MSTRSGFAQGALRTCAASLSMGALAASYAVLSIFYFYQDFFQYAGTGAPTDADAAGWMILVETNPVEGYLLWTILSPWRLAGALIAVVMLGASAVALWRKLPRARSLSLLTLWGVVFPQVLWYTEFLADWHQGQGIGQAVLVALAACAVPTMLLCRRGQPLADWNCTSPTRLLGFAVATAWIGFCATEFIDHSYKLDSSSAYLGAVVAVVLSIVAVRGIYQLRAWGLIAGLGAAVALAVIPLSAMWADFSPNILGPSYSDAVYTSAAGSDLRVVLTMLLPVAALWIAAAPFLHGFFRRLRLPAPGGRE